MSLVSTDPKISPAYQLWQATNAWQRAVRRVLDPLGLTHVQFIILASALLLAEEHELVTQAMICRFAGLDENMTSQVVKSLAAKCFLERGKHPTDGRAHVISLTPAGHLLTTEARLAVRPVTIAFFAPLGERAQELASMLSELTSEV